MVTRGGKPVSLSPLLHPSLLCYVCLNLHGHVQVALLQGTAAMRAAHTIMRSFELSFVELEPILQEAVGAPHRPLTKGDLRWGFSMLLSRLVRLPSRDLEALIPWADMLNHDPSADCFLDWDAPTESVVLRPDRNYQAGEQASSVSLLEPTLALHSCREGPFLL